MFLRVMENSLQSIWRSEDGAESGDRREKKSTAAPTRICDLMVPATGGGYRAGVFGGKEERA